MLYVWKTLNQQGILRSGTIQASSQEEAVSFVRENYGKILELRAVEPRSKYNLKALLHWNQLRFSDKEKIMFFGRLAVILDSGIPLVKGLKLLQGDSHGSINRVSKKLETAVVAGSSLAKAMRDCPKVFSPIEVNLIVVGEKSGELSLILEEIAQYYHKQHEIKNMLIKNSIYPLLVLLISFGVLGVFVGFILPILAGTYASMGVPVTGIMKFSVLLNDKLFEHCTTILLLLVFILCGVYQYRAWCTGILLKLPLVHRAYIIFNEMRLCKLLGVLLACGISITEAVADISTIFGDERLVKQLWVLNSMLKRGESIETAIKCMGGFLSPITIEMITIGAATGYLPKLLTEAAQLGEDNLREELARIKEILGPVLILLTGIIVGAIVYSVMSPMFDMITNLPNYF